MKYFAQKPVRWKIQGVENKEFPVEIRVSGSKHAFLYIFLGALFEPEESYPVTLENVPDITDVYYVCEYALAAGAELNINIEESTITILHGVHKNIILTEYVLNCRSSLLAFTLHALRFGFARIYNCLGGCRIGERNIDQHVRLWNSIGFVFEEDGNYIQLKLDNKIKKTETFSFDMDTSMGSVAAIYCLRHGWIKYLKNISTRIEIDALLRFYAQCNCLILRTKREVTVPRINGSGRNVRYRIPDDVDEAVGWACLCHATGKEAVIHARLPLLQVFQWLEEKSGGEIIYRENYLKICRKSKKIFCPEIMVEASFHPGIGSDQQPVLAVWASLFSKRVFVLDHKFKRRYSYMKELVQLGWNTQMEEEKAVLSFQPENHKLKSTVPVLEAKDLRGGFAELTGILATGKPAVLTGVEQLLRGYSGIEKKLNILGVKFTDCSEDFPNSAAAILKHDDGRYYFQKRDITAPKNPGSLTFFGGRIERNESPCEAVRRELNEELGLDVELDLIDEIQLNEKLFSSSGKVYLFRAKEPVELKNCYEGRICLLDKDQLSKHKMSTFVRCAAEIYFGGEENVNICRLH